jgi:transposase, IS30 family
MDFKIRGERKPQGRKKLSCERAAYSQLMRQGLSNKEACRIVGINPKTGRWRNGRNASGRNRAAPAINSVVPPSAPSRYLCEADRIHIADRLREKATVRAIASELGRSPSTISREIRRNGMRLRGDVSAGPTAPSLPRPAQTLAGPAPSRARSAKTLNCETSSRTT